MKVLTKGEAHKRDIMEAECSFCGSKLRILEGDPRSKRTWSGHNGVNYELLFKCPVCGQLNLVRTHHDHQYEGLKVEEDAFITMEDKKEIESWIDDKLEDLTDDDLVSLWNKYCEKIYRERHPKEEDEYI